MLSEPIKQFMRILCISLVIFLMPSCNGKKDDHGKHYFKTSLLTSSTLPVVNIPTAGDKSTKYIVDTGCGKTIIDRKFYREHPNHFKIVDKIKFNAFTANGILVDSAYVAESMIDSLSVMVVIMDIDDLKRNTYTSTGQIVNGIIGSDYMSQHDAVIDFKEKTFTIK